LPLNSSRGFPAKKFGIGSGFGEIVLICPDVAEDWENPTSPQNSFRTLGTIPTLKRM